MNTVTDLLRHFAFFIDRAVYSVIPWLYKIIIYLANVNIGINDSLTLGALMSRLYILIGIFMLFKLAFSIIRYIFDPDSFSDKTKGFTGILKRIMIALILLVLTPTIFSKMYELQGMIISNNIIPNLILGTKGSQIDDLDSAAKDIQFLLFSPFFSINYESATGADVCKPTSEYPLANMIGSRDMVNVNNGACLKFFADSVDKKLNGKSFITLEDFFKTAATNDPDNYDDISDDRRFESFDYLVEWGSDSGGYVINYIPIISTLCGGYLVFLLLSFCIDIAGRAIRLIIMQILSPVAIISSVDPSSSTQSDKLKDWAKECLTAYASLFLRLAVVYLAIDLAKIMTETVLAKNPNIYYDSSLNNNSMNIYIYVFLILGVFQVAKKIPELIEKAFGIKLSGELNLNPFKALGDNKAFQVGAGVALGGAVGAVSGAFGGAMTARGLGKNVFAGALGGLASGAVRGQYGGLKSGNVGKSFSNALKAGGRVSKAQQVRAETGGWRGIPAMLADRALYEMGAPTTFQSQDSRVQRYKNIDKSMKEVEDLTDAEMRKTWNTDAEAVAFRAQEEEMMRAETAFRTTGEATAAVVEVINTKEKFEIYAKKTTDSIKAAEQELQQKVDIGRLNEEDEEYKRIQANLKARREQMKREKEEFENNGKLILKSSPIKITSAEEMDAYRDQANQSKNVLRASYIDEITSEKSGNYNAEIASARRKVDKTARDTDLYKEMPTEGMSWLDIASPSGYQIDSKTGEFRLDKDGNKIKTIRKRSKEEAANIEFSSRYDDSRDRDKALHDTAQRAHINDKK